MQSHNQTIQQRNVTMNEKIDAFASLVHALQHMALLAVVGLAVGIGQLLTAEEHLTKRVIIGRCVTSAGLGIAAGAALAWVPELPLVAQCGIAAALSSLGTSGLSALLARITKRG